MKVRFHGKPAEVGTELTAGATRIGLVTSRAGHEGLATVRTDRLQDAASAGLPVTAADTLVEITVPPSSVPSTHAVDHGGL